MLCQGSILPPQTFRFTGPQLHGPSASDDLEVPLQFPVGDAVQPLAPFPFAGCGEVVDEVVAEPVARHLRLLEDATGLDKRAWRAPDVLVAMVGAADGLRRECQALLDAV